MDTISLYTIYRQLAKQWKENTGGYSTMRQIASDKNYQAIVDMGIKAVPFILQDLTVDPDWWFVALETITGANPVPKDEEHLGRLDKMAACWTQWGRDNDMMLTPPNGIRKFSDKGNRKPLYIIHYTLMDEYYGADNTNAYHDILVMAVGSVGIGNERPDFHKHRALAHIFTTHDEAEAIIKELCIVGAFNGGLRHY